MKMPAPYWPMTYSASRRQHHHRCAACNRIVADGEQVFMAKMVGKKTRVLHEGCAGVDLGGFGFTALQHLEAWGYAYLAALGFKDAIRWRETAPICHPGGTAMEAA